MDNKNTRTEKLKIIFATHPDKNEVFMTSDDRAFFVEHQAAGFAQTLKDRKVTKFTRALVEAFAKVGEAKNAVKPESNKGGLEITIEAAPAPKTSDEPTPSSDETEEKSTEENATDTTADAGKSEEGDAPTDTAGADQTASDTVDKPLSADEERAALADKYEDLLGKKPAWNLGLEKMKAAIAEAEAAQ